MHELSYYWINKMAHLNINVVIFLTKYRNGLNNEYNDSDYSFISDYQHPFVYLVLFIFPSNLGPFLLGGRTHLSSYLIWIIFLTLARNEFYSGYNFPWSIVSIIPYSANTEFHVFNRKYNNGNYGFLFAISDAVCGTMSIEYLHHLQKQLKEYKEYKSHAKTN